MYTGPTTGLDSVKRTHRQSPHVASRQRRSPRKNSVQDRRHTISRTSSPPTHSREAHKEQQCALLNASCALSHYRQGADQEANVVAHGKESETVSNVTWRAVTVCQYRHCGCHFTCMQCKVCLYKLCSLSTFTGRSRRSFVAVKVQCALIC